MKIIRNPRDSEVDRPTVLTWGVYDGLHIGHQAIIRRVVERARALEVTPTMVTFEPHPRAVLRPETAPALLQTFDQRMEGLDGLGIRQTVVVDFTKEFASTPPDRFLRDLIFGRYDAREVYLGEGVAFGHRREGRFELVQQVAQDLDRLAVWVDEITHRHHGVRSTTIRRLLKAGYINLPRRMLGRPYEAIGRVVRGRGVGSELLVSTANLELENVVVPANGVYVTAALIDGVWMPSATNIGTRPTFGAATEVGVECHILGLQRDLLGHHVRVRFLHRLRDEKRFPDAAALKRQIMADLHRTRRYFNSPAVRRTLNLT